MASMASWAQAEIADWHPVSKPPVPDEMQVRAVAGNDCRLQTDARSEIRAETKLTVACRHPSEVDCQCNRRARPGVESIVLHEVNFRVVRAARPFSMLETRRAS